MVVRLEQMIHEHQLIWEPDFQNAVNSLPIQLLQGWLATADEWTGKGTFCDQVHKTLETAVVRVSGENRVKQSEFSGKLRITRRALNDWCRRSRLML